MRTQMEVRTRGVILRINLWTRTRTIGKRLRQTSMNCQSLSNRNDLLSVESPSIENHTDLITATEGTAKRLFESRLLSPWKTQATTNLPSRQLDSTSNVMIACMLPTLLVSGSMVC
jgi:hypothetical protein